MNSNSDSNSNRSKHYDCYIDMLGQGAFSRKKKLETNNSNDNGIQRKQTDDTLSSGGGDTFSNNNLNFNGENNNISNTNSNSNSYGASGSNTLADPTELALNEDIQQKLYAKLLRTRDQVRVTNIELFFDLVFVYASMSKKWGK
jgi:hypothetical protein